MCRQRLGVIRTIDGQIYHDDAYTVKEPSFRLSVCPSLKLPALIERPMRGMISEGTSRPISLPLQGFGPWHTFRPAVLTSTLYGGNALPLSIGESAELDPTLLVGLETV